MPHKASRVARVVACCALEILYLREQRNKNRLYDGGQSNYINYINDKNRNSISTTRTTTGNNNLNPASNPIYNLMFRSTDYNNQQHQQQQQQQQQQQECDLSKGRVGVDQVSNNEVKYASLLPLRAISSLFGKVSYISVPTWLRPTVFGIYCDWFRCDMSEAMDSDYRNYRNLGEFFSRRLKSDKRPISQEPGVVSPADGLVLHIGPLRNGLLKDVKQIDYSVQTFLGLDSDNYEKELIVDKENNQLYNCIIYLGPGDCHRFHSPSKWLVDYRRHFPGRLYSVKPSKVKERPEILHINERVCYMGTWEHGFFSMTAVGATNVGSIKVNFDEDLRTNRRHLWRPNCFEHKFDKPVEMKTGQDFGEFNFGSTIVLIFEAPKNLSFDINTNQRIRYGELLSKIDPNNRQRS